MVTVTVELDRGCSEMVRVSTNAAYGNKMKMLLMGMKNGTSILEKQLEDFSKVKYTLAL